ncbi:MAG: DUF2147 domain-containing protein [Gammaproteobacteria bacterium]
MRWTKMEIILVAVMLLSLNTELFAEQPMAGLWVMPDASALLEIRPENDSSNSESFEIRIISVLNSEFSSADDVELMGQPRTDRKNADEALKSRSLEGLKIGQGFQLEGARLTGGTIYDPESGKNYRAQLQLEEDGLLRVRAYLGFSVLGQTMHWRRANEFKETMLQMLADIPD